LECLENSFGTQIRKGNIVGRFISDHDRLPAHASTTLRCSSVIFVVLTALYQVKAARSSQISGRMKADGGVHLFDQAATALDRLVSGRSRFRVVLTIGSGAGVSTRLGQKREVGTSVFLL
jgi:hypothetical protein